MPKFLSPPPKLMFQDADGVPMITGLLYTYEAGSTTPLATFTDSTGNTANTNPVELNVRGEANVWLSPIPYKFILKTPAGSTIWTVDNIVGVGITVSSDDDDDPVDGDGTIIHYESWVIVCSDETTAFSAGNAIVTIPYWPFAMAVTEVVAGVTTAQASGNILTFDINDDGVSILSTKATIDNTELTSATAATPLVIVTDTIIAKGSKVTFDVDQIGNGSATGLKIVMNGYRT